MKPESLRRGFARLQFRSDCKTRQGIWRKLATLLKEGIPILSALQEIRSLRKFSAPAAVAIEEWIRGINNGRPLSEMVQPWVNTEEAMLIVAGEQSGSLEQALASAVKVASAGSAIRAAVLSGLAYPLFLLVVAFAVLYFFGFKIIPAFQKAAAPEVWTGLARTMIGAAAFIQHGLPWLAAAAVLLVTVFFVALPRWNGRLRVLLDRHVPFSIYRVMQGSSWLIALSALVQAGMRIETAIDQLGRNTSAWGRVRCEAALKGLRAGRDLGESLERSGNEFPDREIIADLRLYARRSGFDLALRTLGDQWITESVQGVTNLMNLVFAVAVLMVGLLVMFMAAGFLALQTQLMEIMRRAGP